MNALQGKWQIGPTRSLVALAAAAAANEQIADRLQLWALTGRRKSSVKWRQSFALLGSICRRRRRPRR